CYVSGHPLDDYKKAYEKATVNSLTINRVAKDDKAEKEAMAASGRNPWQMRNSGRVHSAVGMLMELRTIVTKKGVPMAFAKLQDYNGSFDLTFFPKTWETMKDKIENDKVYAFRGKIDSSRETPSMLVDSIEDPSVLQEKAIEEIHIQLDGNFSDERQIFSLKEYLFGVSGTCSVYFHIDTPTDTYIVKAANQLQAPATKEVLEDLKGIPLVKDVWTV
ncbi:OB-fold nucleic acid binding domain-containing protein, partial [Treponema sp.]|uniref:OB-fold nucleic acid binding domain-containing protein n=1 Tax=Treponema sp. TaxID=166 RepID=UPI0025DA8F8E